jgi:hypothetical protein
MIRQERILDFPYIGDDPVRPELSMEFRTTAGREVYSYIYEGEIASVVCVAYTTEVPVTIEEMNASSLQPQEAICAIFYTIWSYKKGFGRSLILEGIPALREKYPNLKRIVTLSPKTEMAYKFHTKNGARYISNNQESDNYEYNIY